MRHVMSLVQPIRSRDPSQQNDQQFRSLLTALPYAIVIVKGEGRLAHLSHQLAALPGAEISARSVFAARRTPTVASADLP